MVSVDKVDEDRHGQTVEDSKMAEGEGLFELIYNPMFLLH